MDLEEKKSGDLLTAAELRQQQQIAEFRRQQQAAGDNRDASQDMIGFSEDGTSSSNSRTPGDDADQRTLVQKVLQLLRERLQQIVGALKPQEKNVGVENRFYYDEVEKIWKLQGGETEQERAESEAIRFHTSRGMNSALAPPTTACDASRGLGSNDVLPPPPTTGPVCLPRSGNTALRNMYSLPSDPVYAPSSGLAVYSNTSEPLRPPPARNQGLTTASSVPLSSPFGVVEPAPRTSPFPMSSSGTVPVPQSTLTSPFQMNSGVAPPSQTPLASPFPGIAPVPQSTLTSPFQVTPGVASLAQTPLASPFPGNAAVAQT